jgi:EmrB/QacA subfamily drug resistance transporter
MSISLKNVEYKHLVAGVFISGLFMQIMDTTVINVALPQLGRHFQAGNDSLQWVVTGYLVSLAVWIPASGWIGDRVGTKRTFLFAMAAFTAGSALCGLSQSIGQLIGFRVLQGVGGGMMVPVGTAMLFRAFPPRERARAAVFLTIPAAIAPVVGPILGGWLVDGPGWRWIFYINLPVGIIAFLFALKVLREHREEAAGSLDLPGFVLSGASLALVLYALSQAPSEGWGSSVVVATGLAGGLCFAAMVMIELNVPKPMLDLRLFSDRMFRSSSMALFMTAGGLLGLIFLLALYLQQLRDLSAFQTGLAIFPLAIGMGLTAQLTSRIYGRVGPRRMIAFGLFVVTITSAAFLRVDEDTSLWWIRGVMFVRGVGMSFAMVSLQAATFATIAPPSMGRASSLFATNRQVASAVGVAVLATVLIERTASHLSDLGAAVTPAAAANARLLGFQDAFLVLTVMGVLGFASAFLIRDKDAEATMQRGPGAEGGPPMRAGMHGGAAPAGRQ